MTQVRVFTLVTATGSFFEALCSTSIGFHFWHNFLLVLWTYLTTLTNGLLYFKEAMKRKLDKAFQSYI
jgi:hypothetical protein